MKMDKTQMVSLPLGELNTLLALEYVVGEALHQGLITQEFIDQVSNEFEGVIDGLENK